MLYSKKTASLSAYELFFQTKTVTFKGITDMLLLDWPGAQRRFPGGCVVRRGHGPTLSSQVTEQKSHNRKPQVISTSKTVANQSVSALKPKFLIRGSFQKGRRRQYLMKVGLKEQTRVDRLLRVD